MPTTDLAAPPAANPSRSPTVRAPVQPHQPSSINDPSVQAADAWLRRFQAALVLIMAAFALGVGAVAFFTSFEAIRAYAKGSGGITPQHAWAIPLLVDSFIVIATGAELWLGVHPIRRAWWELAWPRALLAGAAAVSFVLNVAHAKAGDWPARGVAAIPPAALVLSVELLVMIARRAAIARTNRLTTANLAGVGKATVVVRGDQATTSMVAPAGDPPALEATTSTYHHTAWATDPPGATSLAGDHPADATRDQPPTTPPAKATSGNRATRGATYRKVRELYEGGMTVAAGIARELGVSASYAQRTLRQVKADLAHQATIRPDGRATTDRQPETTSQAELTTTERADQTTSAERGDQAATTERGDGTPTRATTNGNGRTTTNGDRRLSLVRDQEADQGEVPSR